MLQRQSFFVGYCVGHTPHVGHTPLNYCFGEGLRHCKGSPPNPYKGGPKSIRKRAGLLINCAYKR